MKISPERLVSTFLQLVKIDGTSRCEKEVKNFIFDHFKDYVLTIHEDNSGDLVYGNCGNLIMKIRGTNQSVPTVILSAHMDTISSTKNLEPICSNGKITSDGNTILGADNRLGVAIICEVLRSLQENKEKFGNIEVVFSICEEIGLLGIKCFDFSQLKGKYAYVLDSGNTTEGTLINQSPSAMRFSIDVIGKAAHAGIAPENGINAISIASKAITKIPQGKINPETTLNIGFIEGGKATNIVPENVTIKGEIRSYHDRNIDKQWSKIQSVFSKQTEVDNGRVEFTGQKDYQGFYIEPDSEIIRFAQTASSQPLVIQSSFGGSDANVFNQNGIPAVVLGTGSWEPHTNDEYVLVEEISRAAQWIYDIILAPMKK